MFKKNCITAYTKIDSDRWNMEGKNNTVGLLNL